MAKPSEDAALTESEEEDWGVLLEASVLEAGQLSSFHEHISEDAPQGKRAKRSTRSQVLNPSPVARLLGIEGGVDVSSRGVHKIQSLVVEVTLRQFGLVEENF